MTSDAMDAAPLVAPKAWGARAKGPKGCPKGWHGDMFLRFWPGPDLTEPGKGKDLQANDLGCHGCRALGRAQGMGRQGKGSQRLS